MITTQVSTMGSLVPYINVDEFKRSPIANQLKRMVPNSSPADIDAELGQIIRRISAQINAECGQNLAATVDNEIGQVVVDRDGSLRIHTRATPIIEVLSLAVGPDVYSLTDVTDLSHLVLSPWRITLPASRGGSSGNSFPLPVRPGQRLWAQWTYINGYPISVLTAPANAGDTSITVADSTGIVPGQTPLAIEDGKYLETVIPTAVTGNVLTVPPVFYPHQVGVGVSSLPDDIKEALFLLASRLHDSWSMSTGAISHDGTGASRPGGGAARKLCDAGVILAPYRRIH